MARRKGSPRLSPETLELMRNDSGRVYRDTFRPAPGRSVTPIAEGRVIPPAGSGRNFNPRGSFNYSAADEAAAQARGQQDANTLSNYAQLLERLNASRGARRPGVRYDRRRGPNVRDIDLIGRPDRQVPGVRIGDHRKGKDFERMLRSRLSRF